MYVRNPVVRKLQFSQCGVLEILSACDVGKSTNKQASLCLIPLVLSTCIWDNYVFIDSDPLLPFMDLNKFDQSVGGHANTLVLCHRLWIK